MRRGIEACVTGVARWRRGLPSLIAMIVLVGTAGCGGDAGTVDSSSGASGGGAGGNAGTPEPPPPDISVGETIIEISVSQGVVSPDSSQVSVPLGNGVRLLITSDVTEEVHVHGYDLTLDVAKGVPGELTFVADVPGSFEVELEQSGLLLCELRVE